MKNRKNYVMTSTPTLTQSGLLAELLRCHRRKAIEMTQRRTLREQGRGIFENSFSWLRGRAHNIVAGRRFLRGFGEATIPGTLESSTKSISS